LLTQSTCAVVKSIELVLVDLLLFEQTAVLLVLFAVPLYSLPYTHALGRAN
jgi:hypothetical protein